VELKFFGGLSLDETAATLGLSVATVEREWQAARAWLLKSITNPRVERAGSPGEAPLRSTPGGGDIPPDQKRAERSGAEGPPRVERVGGPGEAPPRSTPGGGDIPPDQKRAERSGAEGPPRVERVGGPGEAPPRSTQRGGDIPPDQK
jgi:hypothetical protein